MKNNLLFCCWCMLCACLLAACGHESVTGPAGPQGPPGDTGSNIYYGDLRGTVKVYDTLGLELPSFAGVKVTIDSTGLSTTTDAAGNFQFRHVRAGVYNFTFFKDSSYGISRIRQKNHPGGAQYTQLGNTDVGAIYNGPAFSYLITQDPLGGPYNAHMIFFGYMDRWVLHSWAILTFYGLDSSVSPMHFNKAQREQHIYPGPIPPPYDGDPEFDSSDEFNQTLLRSDSALIQSTNFWWALTFDNPHKISYIDEHGQEIHPCAGVVKGKGSVATLGFQANPFNP